MPHSVFLGVVVLFSSGCRCGVGFCFPFRSFMFSFFCSDFRVVFRCVFLHLDFDKLGCKKNENFAKICRNFDKILTKFCQNFVKISSNFSKISINFCIQVYRNPSGKKHNEKPPGNRNRKVKTWNYEKENKTLLHSGSPTRTTPLHRGTLSEASPNRIFRNILKSWRS